MQPIAVETLRNNHTFRYELLNLVQQMVEGNGGAGNTLLADIKSAIESIIPLIDGLELITGNIKIEAGTINLATDQVELKLTALANSLDSIGNMTAVEAADVALIRPAVRDALTVLQDIQSTTGSDLIAIRSTLDELLQKFAQLYGSSSNIDSSLVAIEQRGRPPAAANVTVWNVESGNYSRPADPTRRMVRVNNNSGNPLGRKAATAFIAYDGVTPDRINHAQVVTPGNSILLDAPTLAFEIAFEGDGMSGTVTIVEYGEVINNAGS